MMLKVLSLGAGVQSTTLALMAARGDIDRPDCAIFADTGWEPAAVYRHLAWLETQLPFPVYHVSAGNIREDIIAGNTARHGIRELLGKGPREYIAPASAQMWIAISRDEAQRAKPSRRRYVVNTHPLLDMRISRSGCLIWLAERQYPLPPKSACVGCPFHDNEQWHGLEPEERADADAVDLVIRDGGYARGMRGQQFMHSSLRPLGEIDFAALVAKGQRQGVLAFGAECEGMCGV